MDEEKEYEPSIATFFGLCLAGAFLVPVAIVGGVGYVLYKLTGEEDD